MADTNKTRPTGDDVSAFIDGVADERRRSDAVFLADLMRDVTGMPAVLWGTSIVGFGSLHYRYASGREGDTAAVAFSPRKASTTLYLTGELSTYEDLLARLGDHEVGKGCLYLKHVQQADEPALRAIVDRSFRAAATA